MNALDWFMAGFLNALDVVAGLAGVLVVLGITVVIGLTIAMVCTIILDKI